MTPAGVGHDRRGRQVDGASSWNNTLVSLRPCAMTLARRGLLECEKDVWRTAAPASVNRTKVPLSCSSSQPFSIARRRPALYSAGVPLS
jgi:hypothetical protein